MVSFLMIPLFIFETAVYDGRNKTWRTLNINTGTVYTMDYGSQEAALNAIENGVNRAGMTVKRVRLSDIPSLLMMAGFAD